MNSQIPITESTIPVVGVVLSFFFVLLIILIAKMPKVGAWVVGSLVLLAPILLWRFAAAGGFAGGEEAIPLLGISASFLFILVVILLVKAPKVGAGLIVALVVMGVLGLFVQTAVTHRRVEHVAEVYYGDPPVATVVEQQTWDKTGNAATHQEFNRVFENYTQPSAVVSPVSPIWSEGLEREFDADIYPSRLAAARALGLQMVAPISKVVGDPNTPFEIILFQENNGRDLVVEFARSLEKKMPELKYSIEADLRNIRSGEAGITFRLDKTAHVVNYSARTGAAGSEIKIVSSAPSPIESGGIVATAFAEDRRASAEVRFVDKPWVEDFAAFASTRPDQHFIIARSNGTCTSEGEANQQALNDARARLTEALRTDSRWKSLSLPQPAVTTKDVLQGHFVADRFAQSFAGSVGRIWRQALLVDVSGPTLAKLAELKAREMRSERMSWARMGLSAVGVIVLIGAIYFFLNMATMGYYEWSLRIAGIVLAIVAVLSVLMIVR